MPRFYIDFRYGDDIAKDDVGIDLPNLEEAIATAVISGREVLADNIKSHTDNPMTEIIINDQSGAQFATILAKDILPERLK